MKIEVHNKNGLEEIVSGLIEQVIGLAEAVGPIQIEQTIKDLSELGIVFVEEDGAE